MSSSNICAARMGLLCDMPICITVFAYGPEPRLNLKLAAMSMKILAFPDKEIKPVRCRQNGKSPD